jgi:hypothetical protein
MYQLATNRVQQLDQLLGTAIAEFDIPDDVYQLAVSRYGAVAVALADYWDESPSDGLVYPQGSFRLGTVVQPINPDDEYDIDLVCRRDLQKESITQQALKADIGYGLNRYVASQPAGNPVRAEGVRCWTLNFPLEPFHMDVLPALPDAEGSPNAILLTDRRLREWQHSNPVDYASWFHARMREEFLELRQAVAKQMDIEEVPDSRVKTTLQRTVQALKRHRDIYFGEQPHDRPASIIVTTLAATAYTGGGSISEILPAITGQMASLVERRSGIYWVANPVQPEENFADRWRYHPGSDQRFFEWIERAHLDFSGYGSELGLDSVLAKVAKSLGESPARGAARVAGAGVAGMRDAGVLGIGVGTGALGRAVGRPVRAHTFHGDT